MPVNAYWDGISALKFRDRISIQGEVIDRYGVEQTIIMEENRLFASREDDEELGPQIEDIRPDRELQGKNETQRWNFLLSRKKIDVFSSLFGLLYIPEVIGKYIGALFVDLHVAVRQENLLGGYGWLFPWAITCTLNACVAQPLFFASNILLHTRGVLDGLGAILYGCATAKPKAIWAGVKGIFRGLACLAIDALAIGVMVGVAVACSLMFQPHVALGVMPLIANVHSVAIASIAGQAIIASTTTVATVAASIGARAVVSAPLSTASCLQKLGAQPDLEMRGAKNDLPEFELPRSDNVITTGFGFRPRVISNSRRPLLGGDDSPRLAR